MNLKAHKPKNITEGILLLFAKITGRLIQQTQTKAQETLKVTLRNYWGTFSFDIPS